MTQTAAIAAINLALLGSGGSYSLTNASNNIDKLAADRGHRCLRDSAKRMF